MKIQCLNIMSVKVLASTKNCLLKDVEENFSLMLKILTAEEFKPVNLFSNLIFK